MYVCGDHDSTKAAGLQVKKYKKDAVPSINRNIKKTNVEEAAVHDLEMN